MYTGGGGGGGGSVCVCVCVCARACAFVCQVPCRRQQIITVNVAMRVTCYMPSWHGQGTRKRYVFSVHAMKT